MGIMDNMKDSINDKKDDMNIDSMKARIEELRHKDEMGQLDDNGRQELSMLKSKIKM